jgi:uncharacterized membrane protein
MRAIGVRELTAGAGILARDRPAGWMWSRVAGDLMDLALLGSALGDDGNERDRTAAATAAVLGVAALDAICATRLSGPPTVSAADAVGAPAGADRAGIHVRRSITVARPAEEVYAFWHDFQNLPRFMSHLESVQVTGERRSHWKAKAPAGMTVEWDAEIVDDQPGVSISWRSLPEADVANWGTVRFIPAPGDRGTEVRVELGYRPPAGKLGLTIAKLFGEEPATQLADDLRRFKQVLETGEIVVSEGSPRGHELAQQLKQRPAQPIEEVAR